MDCSLLVNAAICDGVEKIGDYAFLSTGLNSVSVPDSVTKLGSYCLGYNENKHLYNYSPVDNFRIYCSNGSAAAQYANNNSFAKEAPKKVINHIDLTADTDKLYFDTAKTIGSVSSVPENTGIATEGCDKGWADTLFINRYDYKIGRPIAVHFDEQISADNKYYILYIVSVREGYEFVNSCKKHLSYTPLSDIEGLTLSLNGDSATDVYFSYNNYFNELWIKVAYYNFKTNYNEGEEISGAKISGIKAKTYNGKAQTQSVTVKYGTKTLKNGTDYTVSYKNNKNAGTATMIITGKGTYKGSVKKTFKINKANNTMTVTNKKTVTANSKKATTIKAAVTVKKAQGNVTYKTDNKKVTVKNGAMTIANKVKVTVTAKGNANYNKLAKTVSVKVKVK